MPTRLSRWRRGVHVTAEDDGDDGAVPEGIALPLLPRWRLLLS